MVGGGERGRQRSWLRSPRPRPHTAHGRRTRRPLSTTMYPTTASMQTRPCFSSASRIHSMGRMLESPSGSKPAGRGGRREPPRPRPRPMAAACARRRLRQGCRRALRAARQRGGPATSRPGAPAPSRPRRAARRRGGQGPEPRRIAGRRRRQASAARAKRARSSPAFNFGKEFYNTLPRTTLGTGLARTGTNTGTPREPEKNFTTR